MRRAYGVLQNVPRKLFSCLRKLLGPGIRGNNAFRAITSLEGDGLMKSFEKTMRGLTGGQREALERKLWLAAGGEHDGETGLKAILDGESEIVVREALQKLFDGTAGRRIPHQGMNAKVVDAHRDFHLVQPEIDYAERLGNIACALTDGWVFISVDEFEARSKAILARRSEDRRTANLIKCAHFPVALPQMKIEDYGTVLDTKILPAVGASYQEQFPERKFHNIRQGLLANQVPMVQGSRHDRFIEALDKGSVVGVYYPCLHGFSIEADLVQMDALPDEFLLAGVIDTAAVEIMYPDVVARDFNTPGLDCAAVRWRRSSLCFSAGSHTLNFVNRDLGGGGGYSGGLLVLG